MKRKTENGKRQVESGKWKILRFPFSVFRFPLSTLLLVFLVFSCSPKKKLVSPTANASNYEWFSAKVNGEMKTENGEMSFTGTVRMRRDSVVWLSASAFLGMENVRTLITEDSVFLVNRLDQTYLAEPLSAVAGKLPLSATLKETQALLLGDGNSDHVEIRFGQYLAKIKYSDIHWNEPTTFPFKINKNYERIKL